jgi:hypothetical protein
VLVPDLKPAAMLAAAGTCVIRAIADRRVGSEASRSTWSGGPSRSALAAGSPRGHLELGKSHDVEVQRHLEAACTRRAGWGEGELPVRPQAEVFIRDRLGDLA